MDGSFVLYPRRAFLSPSGSLLAATPSSSLEQTRSSHSSDAAPASDPTTLPDSANTLISSFTCEKRAPT